MRDPFGGRQPFDDERLLPRGLIFAALPEDQRPEIMNQRRLGVGGEELPEETIRIRLPMELIVKERQFEPNIVAFGIGLQSVFPGGAGAG